MEEKKIKLTPEQIQEKELQLFNTEKSVEMIEMNIRHYQEMIDKNIPILQTKMLLEKEKKQLEVGKHNIQALKEQIQSGEM
jgi:hypothetical protein